MAINKLPTDFVDAVTSQRKYEVTDVGNSEALFDDVSEYSVYGSPFGAHEINAQHKAVNDAIDVEESVDAEIKKLLNGTKILASVTHAESVISAETADTANYATSATHADHVARANSATTADSVLSANTASHADNAGKATKLVGAEINGVNFDGTANITIEDSSKLSTSKSFILQAKQALTFTNKVCTISDNRITADSLAEVVFTANCIDNARKAVISVDTSNGAVTIRAGRTPQGTLTATVFIRVVD